MVTNSKFQPYYTARIKETSLEIANELRQSDLLAARHECKLADQHQCACYLRERLLRSRSCR